jgi:hypothetical protein
MVALTARVEHIVSLVAELTPDERVALAQQIEASEPNKRARVAEAIGRVVRDHPNILAELAK